MGHNPELDLPDDEFLSWDQIGASQMSKNANGTRKPAVSIISASDLMAKKFEPVRYVVPGYIADGLTLFAGAPKIGKSWMALDFALSIASGNPTFGSIPIRPGDVLYLALEDGQRRLKSRMLAKGIKEAPPRLHFATEWPTLDEGCIEELEKWADEVENPALIIIDVLKKVRGQTRGNENLYESDYRAMTGLQSFATNRNLAVLVVHHVRKMAAEDPLESVSGTNGLTGAADTIMVLKKDNGTARCTLYVRGRDVEELETAVEFKRDNRTWSVLGAAQDVGRTAERDAIMQVLRKHPEPVSVQEISDILGKSKEAVRRCCSRMAHDGEIEKTGRALYTCPTSPNVRFDIPTDKRTHRTGGMNSGKNEIVFPSGNPALKPLNLSERDEDDPDPLTLAPMSGGLDK
jgi:biotin operon repressor